MVWDPLKEKGKKKESTNEHQMVWDPLKEQGKKKKMIKTKSWFEKKMVELESLRLKFYMEYIKSCISSFKNSSSNIDLKF